MNDFTKFRVNGGELTKAQKMNFVLRAKFYLLISSCLLYKTSIAIHKL